MKQLLTLSLSLIFLLSCGPESSPLNLKGEKTSNHTHIGKGVWIKNPGSFDEATSFMGLQALGYNGSISLKPQDNGHEI